MHLEAGPSESRFFQRDRISGHNAGIPPEKVLQVVTLGAAQVAKADRELGSIQPGKRADLVLISGDPVRNISDIRRCTLVIRNGAEYRSADLYAALGIRP